MNQMELRYLELGRSVKQIAFKMNLPMMQWEIPKSQRAKFMEYTRRAIAQHLALELLQKDVIHFVETPSYLVGSVAVASEGLEAVSLLEENMALRELVMNLRSELRRHEKSIGGGP